MNHLQRFNETSVQSLVEKNPIPPFRSGDNLRVHIKIQEGSRERMQVYEGVCIARSNSSIHSSFTVRKVSSGEGVERVFPLYSPHIRIERTRQGKVRRAKLYYLRNLWGKKARIKEKIVPRPQPNPANI